MSEGPNRDAGYETDRPDVQALVPATARNVLELGCSNGALGAALKRRGPLRVLGVEYDPAYTAAAAGRLDRVITGDAGAFATGPHPPEAPFDCLIAADLLEHLVDPWSTLRGAVTMLEPGATVIVSLPNVLFWAGLLRLVRGRRWPREEEGLFDRTHLRWFSADDAVGLLEQAGVTDVVVHPRYWVEGAALRRRELLARTPLKPFLAPQHLLAGRKA